MNRAKTGLGVTAAIVVILVLAYGVWKLNTWWNFKVRYKGQAEEMVEPLEDRIEKLEARVRVLEKKTND